jgi:hypothetical protein
VDTIPDLAQWRSIILRYNEHRIADPFMTWFRARDPAGAFSSVFEKVLIVLIDARFDQQTRAEHALDNTKRVFRAGALKRVIERDEVPLMIPRQRMTTDRWTDLFYTSQRRLRRLANRIVEQPRWSASALLACMLSRDYKVPYLGLKTSRLAVRWLHELVPELDIDMSDFMVPVDVLVYRVASRLGIIDPHVDTYAGADSPADRKIQSFAKVLFPHNPWYLDEPLWSTGRQPAQGGHCYPTAPHCHGCLFDDVCLKQSTDLDPSTIGMDSTPPTRTRRGSEPTDRQKLFAVFVQELKDQGIRGETYRHRIKEWRDQHS